MAKAEFDFIHDDDPWDRAVAAGGAFALVLVGGTIAYRILGLSWFDAFYQTLITVSTVGFTEVGPEQITPMYRLVSSVLILVGVGIGVYSIGLVFEAVMEGRLTDQIGRARMRKEIEQASGHTIVCGWGQVGRAITTSLLAAGEQVVVIDRRSDLLTKIDALAVTGEATDDDVLRMAGIDRAKSLVVALDGESDNLYVTLSGRALNPALFIVTRAVGPTSGSKLVQAGADRVVNPHEIGASRMASFVLQPNVADFLGETMTDRNLQVRLGEVEVTQDGSLAARPLGDSGFLSATGLTLLAIRRPDGSFIHRRDDHWVPAAGDLLIVLGTPEQHYAASAWLAGS
jgi:voltage-gated potassium channel